MKYFQNKKIIPLGIFITLYLIVLVPLLVFNVQQRQDIRQRADTTIAWDVSQTAVTVCPPYGTGANINVTFTNDENDKPSLSMNVIVTDKQTGKFVDLGAIRGGQTKSGVIQTGKTILSANSVTFALTWTDGHSGKDSRTATYKAIANCYQPPTPTPTRPYSTPTPTYLPTPTPTRMPTPTYIPTPTPTYKPTATPIPSPTYYAQVPTPTYAPTGYPTQGLTSFALTIFQHGIGISGDNTNAEGSFSNKNPQHKTINAELQLFDQNNNLYGSGTGQVTYDSKLGGYTGSIGIFPNQFSSGKYTLKVRTDRHLRKLMTGVQTINAGQHNTSLPPVTLVTGDINNNNAINILDYNMLLDCYSDLVTASNCQEPGKKDASDLNDDGPVNQIDYNLFLREIATQPGS